MLKLPITFRTHDGVEKTKDFYFNLTKGDVLKIHLTLPGGFDGFIKRLEDEPEVSDVLNVFEKLILSSYGKRMPDGKYVKSPELTQEFAASDAYSELLLKFINNEEDFANKFLEGAMDMNLGDVQKMIDENPEIKAAASKITDSL